jgi:hypothetical protein
MDSTSSLDVGDALQGAVNLFLGFGSDVFIFITLVALIAVFAFYFGRDRLMPLVAGIYAALVLYAHFPYTEYLTSPYLSIGLFFGLSFVGMIAFSGLAGFFSSSGVGFIKVVGLSVITALFVMAVAVNILPASEIHTFSTPTLALFAKDFFFWWLVAPLVGVFILGK